MKDKEIKKRVTAQTGRRNKNCTVCDFQQSYFGGRTKASSQFACAQGERGYWKLLKLFSSELENPTIATMLPRRKLELFVVVHCATAILYTAILYNGKWECGRDNFCTRFIEVLDIISTNSVFPFWSKGNVSARHPKETLSFRI